MDPIADVRLIEQLLRHGKGMCSYYERWLYKQPAEERSTFAVEMFDHVRGMCLLAEDYLRDQRDLAQPRAVRRASCQEACV